MPTKRETSERPKKERVLDKRTGAVAIPTPPLKRTGARAQRQEVVDTSCGRPQLFLGTSTTHSTEVHNLFCGNPQLVLVDVDVDVRSCGLVEPPPLTIQLLQAHW